MASDSSPQLMSIPRELRDLIYNQVFDFPPTISESNTKQWKIRRSSDHPITVNLTPISFNWLDLMRTNGLIADEMRQLYNIPAYHNNTSRQTWHAILSLNDDLTLTWTDLPCPSSCVKHLVIDFHISLKLGKFGHWDNDAIGQPGNIFQSLFQLLNQVIHRGPNITCTDPLPRPISLQTLDLNIRFPDEEKNPILGYSGPESFYIIEYGKRRIVGNVIENLITASGNGFLGGKVGHVTVIGPKSQGLQKTDINVSRTDERNVKTEEKWRSNGFYWGLGAEDSCVGAS